jgi:drug/metabolite transporter (DMT)-like permease
MSVVIPVFVGFILFSDNINFLKLAGIATALLAFYLTLKRKEKIKLTSKYLIFPLLLFLGNGINDSLLKYTQHNYIGNDIVLFLATVFSVSFILGFIILVVKRLYTKDRFEVKNIIAGIILGLLNWASTYYFIKGLYFFQVSCFVPIFNLGIVILSTLFGFLIFREKLRPVNWAGIILSVLAILVIAYS